MTKRKTDTKTRGTSELQEQIARRKWRTYHAPLMQFMVQIESPLIIAMEEQLPWADMWAVLEGIATMAWDSRSRLTAVHCLGCSIAQAEVLTPTLGFNIHMLSNGTMIYATMQPMMSYDDGPLTEAQLGLVEH